MMPSLHRQRWRKWKETEIRVQEQGQQRSNAQTTRSQHNRWRDKETYNQTLCRGPSRLDTIWDQNISGNVGDTKYHVVSVWARVDSSPN